MGIATDPKNNKMFKSLKHKFIATCSIIGVLVVLIIFLIIFLVCYTNMQNQIDDSLSKTIYDYENHGGINNSEKFNDKKHCITIISLNDTVASVQGLELYTCEEKATLINTARSTTESKVKLGKKYFKFQKKQIKNPIKKEIVYAIYDYTAERYAIKMLNIGFTSSLFFSIWIFSLIGYIFAQQVVKPGVDAFQNQRDLVANVSHELKTPLTIMSTNLNLIDTSSLNDDSKKWIKNSKLQIEKMNKLVLEMLELSKFQSTFFKPKMENANISDIFEAILLSFEATCFEKNINLETKIEKNIYCSINHESFNKLLSILCDNAIKYVPQNGKIRAGLQKEKKNLKLTISNTGEGIPQKDIDHIFERFYKMSNEENDTKSFGLGLAIAKSIVDAMNGEIECLSEEGKYTAFIVTLNAEKPNSLNKIQKKILKKVKKIRDNKSNNDKKK